MLRSFRYLVTFVSTALVLHTLAAPSQSPRSSTSSPHPHTLIGYFPQWGIYNQPQYLVKNLATGKAPLVDQINYAQGFVTDGHCSVADPNADLNYTFTATQSVDGKPDSPTQRFRGNLHQLQKLKRKYPRLHILISLEGRSTDFAYDAQPEHRTSFVSSCIDTFLKGHFASDIAAPGIFDGIDIDWEYPHQEDAANYLALLHELRRQMDALHSGLLLTVAVGPSPHMYEGTDMAAVGRIVDRVGLMTYDFTGPWNDTTGLIAPLTALPTYRGGTVTRCVESYLAAGVPAKKLIVGLPFYGYGWHQVTETDHGLAQEGEPIHGDRPYSYIAGLVAQSTVYRDPDSQTPWLFDGDIFWTYDDPLSIDRKAAYVRDRKLGGLMIWELGEDNLSADLLHAAYHSLQSTSLPKTPRSTTPIAPTPAAMTAVPISSR